MGKNRRLAIDSNMWATERIGDPDLFHSGQERLDSIQQLLGHVDLYGYAHLDIDLVVAEDGYVNVGFGRAIQRRPITSLGYTAEWAAL
jgi:hypothetical protein